MAADRLIASYTNGASKGASNGASNGAPKTNGSSIFEGDEGDEGDVRAAFFQRLARRYSSLKLKDEHLAINCGLFRYRIVSERCASVEVGRKLAKNTKDETRLLEVTNFTRLPRPIALAIAAVRRSANAKRSAYSRSTSSAAAQMTISFVANFIAYTSPFGFKLDKL
uniref:Uncharacterized protein n=1 Tax=Plectus sambesii TaxID=2011161 RepID=A0A914UZB1_9BILA